MREQKNNIRLSVFFPCYNEELNIDDLVSETISLLNDLVIDYEILIINDGSSDNTGLLADSLSKKYDKVRVIHHEINQGYGAALISGFSNAVYEWVFFTDGDHQFHINEIERFLENIDKNDLIIGFRKKRQDPWHRILYAYAWNRLVRILFNLKIKDLNCAFKLIRKNTLDRIELNSRGANINTEILLKAKYTGAQIYEIGVSHKPRKFGKQTGGNPKVFLKAFLELRALRNELKNYHLGEEKA